MSEEINEQTVETAPAEDSGVYDVDGIAAMFDDGADGEEDSAGEGTEGEGEESEGTGEEGGGEISAEADGEEDLPEVPMPEGFDAEAWGALPGGVKSAIHEREQAHAAALAKAADEQKAVKAEQEKFAIAANAQIQQALATMKQIVEGEYGSVDWNSLAQSDPSTYIRMQQAYNARMGAIQNIQKSVAQEVQKYEAARLEQARKDMAAEFAGVHPEIKALMGAGFEGKSFAADMAKYMQEQGCPPEVIGGLSKGYEVKMIAKAMLYDRMQAQRAAAAKKVAEAPKVQKPHGAASAENDGRAQKARAMLNKNPNSVDALAAVFEAM